MHRFTSDTSFVLGAEIELTPDQSHHLARVLRLEPGEEVGLVNGKGGFARARLVDVRTKASRLVVLEVIQADQPSAIRLCFALPKGQALDFLFRRCTELGLRGFQPLETRFSSRFRDWNHGRWKNTVAEVCKQCEELFFPEIFPPLKLEDWLTRRDSHRRLIYCDENARQGLLAQSGESAYDLVVGAEGGFDPWEIEGLKQKGGIALGLGRNRLRAETAALVALTLVKNQIGDL